MSIFDNHFNSYDIDKLDDDGWFNNTDICVS